MALRGNLRDFSITQLLNLINLARKTGTLVIDGPVERAQVVFREGKLAFARVGKDDPDLAGVLQRNRKISSSQANIIRQRAGHMSDKEVGLLLINAGYLSQRDIIESLQHHCAGLVRRLFTWVEGGFLFEQDIQPPNGKIPVRMDLENLIIESSRQMREWEQLQAEIPSLDMALKFTDRPGTNLRNINLSVEEWRVVRYVNPKNTMRQIAHASRMNDIEIRRVVYALLQAGLVEITRPGGSPPVMVTRAFPVAKKEEQRSLVHRLINRIRSI